MHKTFTPSEFIKFAKSVQHLAWETLATKKSYQYHVDGDRIKVVPSTGDDRLILISELEKFCRIFAETNSFKTSDYSQSFNKSYLLPIAKLFQPPAFVSRLAEELDPSKTYVEGATKNITVNAYERSAEARRKCIEHHGNSCSICGFNFAKKYGEFADGFIHVHHLSPISCLKGEREIDPITDLRPVCPNCHAVIHLQGGCLSLEEVLGLISINTTDN